jgi:hypothetical protein
MDASRQAQVVLAAYRTEYSIYGVVLVSAIIAVSWEDETDLEVLLFTLGSVVVFWLAHIYAGTVAREETEVTDAARYRAILAAALASARHTAGLLIAMVLPTIALLLAVVGLLDEYVAYYLALWVGVAVLAVLGWTASARRGSPWYWRLVSAIVTASLGMLVIWLGALFH